MSCDREGRNPGDFDRAGRSPGDFDRAGRNPGDFDRAVLSRDFDRDLLVAEYDSGVSGGAAPSKCDAFNLRLGARAICFSFCIAALTSDGFAEVSDGRLPLVLIGLIVGILSLGLLSGLRVPPLPSFFLASDGVDGIANAGPDGNFGISVELPLLNDLLCIAVGVLASASVVSFCFDVRLPTGDDVLRLNTDLSIFGLPGCSPGDAIWSSDPFGFGLPNPTLTVALFFHFLTASLWSLMGIMVGAAPLAAAAAASASSFCRKAASLLASIVADIRTILMRRRCRYGDCISGLLRPKSCFSDFTKSRRHSRCCRPLYLYMFGNLVVFFLD